MSLPAIVGRKPATPRTGPGLRQPLVTPAPLLQLYVPSKIDSGTALGTTAMLAALIRTLRPRQWIKNSACLAGLIFSCNLFNTTAQVAALVAMAMFCAAASSIYIINDVCDRKNDRQNPSKARRPIASGVMPMGLALVACAVGLVASGLAACYLGPACLVVLGLYVGMNLIYSIRLKHEILADVMVIALGFVLRVLAGVYAIHVQPTAWIVLCIFFLALLLGLAKRRVELAVLQERAAAHRPVLAHYSLPYLDALLAVMAAMTVVCYAIYTVQSLHNKATLIVTIPPVVYGIARYLLLVMVHGRESPEEILTTDKGILAAVLIWISLCVLVLYTDLHLFD